MSKQGRLAHQISRMLDNTKLLAATACSPQALGPVGVVCVRACVLTSLPLHHQVYTRCSGLARPHALVLQCLDVFLGAGELPSSVCVCAGMITVAPAAGAVLVCACCTGGTRRGLMCVWYLR